MILQGIIMMHQVLRKIINYNFNLMLWSSLYLPTRALLKPFTRTFGHSYVTDVSEIVLVMHYSWENQEDSYSAHFVCSVVQMRIEKD